MRRERPGHWTSRRAVLWMELREQGIPTSGVTIVSQRRIIFRLVFRRDVRPMVFLAILGARLGKSGKLGKSGNFRGKLLCKRS